MDRKNKRRRNRSSINRLDIETLDMHNETPNIWGVSSAWYAPLGIDELRAIDEAVKEILSKTGMSDAPDEVKDIVIKNGGHVDGENRLLFPVCLISKFLREVKKICNKKKILLILDEVQCGIGRSGKFFAFEYSNVKPDIVPIAKGIGGGFPIGAVLMTKKVAKCMIPGTHGSTYGGNPLAMMVGNAVLSEIYKKGFLANVRKNSKYFLFELEKIRKNYPKVIKEVRGVGLLIGLQLNVNLGKFINSLTQNRLLTIRAAENVVRILPPLNVKKNEINLALKIIKKVCKEFDKK